MTLLPDPALDYALHQCSEISAQVHSTQSNLKTCFTDGHSFIPGNQRKAGAVVTMEMTLFWTHSLTPGTSAQRAELIALIQILIMGKELAVNIYMNS